MTVEFVGVLCDCPATLLRGVGEIEKNRYNEQGYFRGIAGMRQYRFCIPEYIIWLFLLKSTMEGSTCKENKSV